jgi:hypothetical protein
MASKTDNFARIDQVSLGANWVIIDGNGLSIASEQAYSATGLENINCWDPAETNFTDDQFSEVTLVSGLGNGIFGGVCVRMQGDLGGGTAAGYLFYSDTNSAAITKMSSSSYTNLQTGLTAFTNGQVIKLSVEGTTLRAYVNGAQVGTDEDLTATPAVITGGQPGLFTYNAGPILDNWTGEDITGGGGGPAGDGINLPLLGVG